MHKISTANRESWRNFSTKPIAGTSDYTTETTIELEKKRSCLKQERLHAENVKWIASIRLRITSTARRIVLWQPKSLNASFSNTVAYGCQKQHNQIIMGLRKKIPWISKKGESRLTSSFERLASSCFSINNTMGKKWQHVNCTQLFC